MRILIICITVTLGAAASKDKREASPKAKSFIPPSSSFHGTSDVHIVPYIGHHTHHSHHYTPPIYIPSNLEYLHETSHHGHLAHHITGPDAIHSTGHSHLIPNTKHSHSIIYPTGDGNALLHPIQDSISLIHPVGHNYHDSVHHKDHGSGTYSVKTSRHYFGPPVGHSYGFENGFVLPPGHNGGYIHHGQYTTGPIPFHTYVYPSTLAPFNEYSGGPTIIPPFGPGTTYANSPLTNLIRLNRQAKPAAVGVHPSGGTSYVKTRRLGKREATSSAKSNTIHDKMQEKFMDSNSLQAEHNTMKTKSDDEPRMTTGIARSLDSNTFGQTNTNDFLNNLDLGLDGINIVLGNGVRISDKGIFLGGRSLNSIPDVTTGDQGIIRNSNVILNTDQNPTNSPDSNPSHGIEIHRYGHQLNQQTHEVHSDGQMVRGVTQEGNSAAQTQLALDHQTGEAYSMSNLQDLVRDHEYILNDGIITGSVPSEQDEDQGNMQDQGDFTVVNHDPVDPPPIHIIDTSAITLGQQNLGSTANQFQGNVQMPVSDEPDFTSDQGLIFQSSHKGIPSTTNAGNTPIINVNLHLGQLADLINSQRSESPQPNDGSQVITQNIHNPGSSLGITPNMHGHGINPQNNILQGEVPMPVPDKTFNEQHQPQTHEEVQGISPGRRPPVTHFSPRRSRPKVSFRNNHPTIQGQNHATSTGIIPGIGPTIINTNTFNPRPTIRFAGVQPRPTPSHVVHGPDSMPIHPTTSRPHAGKSIHKNMKPSPPRSQVYFEQIVDPDQLPNAGRDFSMNGNHGHRAPHVPKTMAPVVKSVPKIKNTLSPKRPNGYGFHYYISTPVPSHNRYVSGAGHPTVRGSRYSRPVVVNHYYLPKTYKATYRQITRSPYHSKYYSSRW